MHENVACGSVKSQMLLQQTEQGLTSRCNRSLESKMEKGSDGTPGRVAGEEDAEAWILLEVIFDARHDSSHQVCCRIEEAGVHGNLEVAVICIFLERSGWPQLLCVERESVQISRKH
jgi:hypothetical protein